MSSMILSLLKFDYMIAVAFFEIGKKNQIKSNLMAIISSKINGKDGECLIELVGSL